jgi:hypothetical protein
MRAEHAAQETFGRRFRQGQETRAERKYEALLRDTWFPAGRQVTRSRASKSAVPKQSLGTRP